MPCEKCCPDCRKHEIEDKGPLPINSLYLFTSQWDEDEVVELRLSYESPDAFGYSTTYYEGSFTLSPSAAKALAERATLISSSPDSNAAFHEEVHRILRLTLDDIRDLAEGADKLTKKKLIEQLLYMTEFDYPARPFLDADSEDELVADAQRKVQDALDALDQVKWRDNAR